MFKKPLNGLKTSAPLRSSDRRKLKLRVVAAFGISLEEGDLLVPDGILSVKFSTHIDEPGIAYLAPDGDPLWFSIGKSSDDLLPTIYTLWKRTNLLPFLSTPAEVIPVLVGGADLMIPGVIHRPLSLREGQLVSILQYNHHSEQPTFSPPLALGRMALSSDQLKTGGKDKGKAVHVIHTWKDHLWDMGSKREISKATPIQPQLKTNIDDNGGAHEEDPVTQTQTPDPTPDPPETPSTSLESYTPQEVTTILHSSLLQAITTTLSAFPSSSFPISSTLFYTNHILPSRPAFPASILEPSKPASAEQTSTNEQPSASPEITIKTSTHKSLTAFLKSAEKASLLTLKSPPKHAQQSDLLVTSVNTLHPSVLGHRCYVAMKDMEARAAKKAQMEEKGREIREGGRELEIRELWKPHQASIELFKEMGGDTTILYTLSEVKALLNSYITSKSLVNTSEQAYINLDEQLIACLSAKSQEKSRRKEPEPEQTALEFMKRQELAAKILEKMQSWYEIRQGGEGAVQRKGALKPIQVTMKIRQGRKACTLITGFEPYLVISAEDMAEELKKLCAGATSVSPIPGKAANSGLEVLVQGKQSRLVVDYLVGKGIPKKRIEVIDASGKK